MGKLTTLIILTILLLSGLAVADDESIATLISSCVACHGQAGEGNAELSAPRLAGQSKVYLAAQMAQFRDGRRGAHADDSAGATMRAIALTIPDTAIEPLANHFSSLEAVHMAEELSGEEDRGEYVYETTCLACHGARAEGSTHLMSPNLKILSYWYSANQLKSFRNGWRGADTVGNTRAAWMRSIESHISQEQLVDVMTYLTSIR